MASRRRSEGPLTTVQPSFICGSPATFERPLIENARQSSTPARVRTLAGVEDCLAFSMSGLSKVAGLPQMKLGWTVVSGPSDLRREAMEKLEWIADTYLSVSTPVQHAAPRLLTAGEA